MIVRAEQLRAFEADGPITQCRALGGAGDDSNMLRHATKSTAEPFALYGNAAPNE
jgi:hypothetical protein